LYGDKCLDQAMIRRLGIEPAALKIIAVNSTLHFRADFDPITAETRVVISSGVDHCKLNDLHYRNLLAYGLRFYALVRCGSRGRRADPRSRGGVPGVRVIEGVATETSFRRQDGRLLERLVTSMSAGEVCGSFDDDIHEIRNNGEDNLVALHIYSPYLDNINLYDRGPASSRCSPTRWLRA
jgi:hypothetical protein